MTSTAPISSGGGSGSGPSSSSSIVGDKTTTTAAAAATTTTIAAQQAASTAAFHQHQHHQQQQSNSFINASGLSSDAVVSGVGVGGNVTAGGIMKGPTTESNNNPISTHTNSKETNNTNNSNQRLSKTAAYLPFVYGSIAFYLGKKADEFQTHEWTLYVRGPNQEDLSLAISKVVFQLHASFAKPVRELTAPPFEVTERGWGEFEAQIRIIWKDPEEKPTVVNHLIKLYPPGAPQNVLHTTNDNVQLQKPVIAEKYDEAVFTDPNESFYRSLGQISVVPKVDFVHWKYVQDTNYDDNEDFMTLLEASKFLQTELTKVKERYKNISHDLSLVDQALIKVSQQKQQQPPQTQSSKSSSRSASRGGGGGGGGGSGGDGGGGTTGGSKKSKSSSSQRKRPSQAKKAKVEK